MSDKKIDFDDRLQILSKMYERKIPFNKVLGLKIESFKIEEVRVRFEMKESFIGNYVHGILHGGCYFRSFGHNRRPNSLIGCYREHGRTNSRRDRKKFGKNRHH